MKSIMMKLTHLPEKWLRHGFDVTKLLQQLFEYAIGLFAVVTASFMLSTLS